MADDVAPSSTSSNQTGPGGKRNARCVVGDHDERSAPRCKRGEPVQPEIETAKLNVKNISLRDGPSMGSCGAESNSRGSTVAREHPFVHDPSARAKLASRSSSERPDSAEPRSDEHDGARFA